MSGLRTQTNTKHQLEAGVVALVQAQHQAQTIADYHRIVGVEALRGRGLRFVLVEHIRRRQTMTVAQLVEALAADGFTLAGRASKAISDALRWEVARGRVKRLGRGVYTYGTVPASTARRIRHFATLCRTWLVAVMRGEQPPPLPRTPENRFMIPYTSPDNPYQTPWANLNWLWST